jgi:hypothetical protein
MHTCLLRATSRLLSQISEAKAGSISQPCAFETSHRGGGGAALSQNLTLHKAAGGSIPFLSLCWHFRIWKMSSQAFHLLSRSKTNLEKDVDSFAILDCFA